MEKTDLTCPFLSFFDASFLVACDCVFVFLCNVLTSDIGGAIEKPAPWVTAFLDSVGPACV